MIGFATHSLLRASAIFWFWPHLLGWVGEDINGKDGWILAVWWTIDHFTVIGIVTLPLNDSEAGGDLVLKQTSLLLLCRSSCSYAN